MRNDMSGVGRDRFVERLLDWHDQAKLAGRDDRAAELLQLAWRAFDQVPCEPRLKAGTTAPGPGSAYTQTMSEDRIGLKAEREMMGGSDLTSPMDSDGSREEVRARAQVLPYKRPLNEVAERLISWHEEAARAGRRLRADYLLDFAGILLDACGRPEWMPLTLSNSGMSAPRHEVIPMPPQVRHLTRHDNPCTR